MYAFAPNYGSAREKPVVFFVLDIVEYAKKGKSVTRLFFFLL